MTFYEWLYYIKYITYTEYMMMSLDEQYALLDEFDD